MTYQFDPILGQGRDGAVSLAEQQKGFDAGGPAAKAAFQASVSGDRWGVMQTVQVAEPVGGVAYTLKAPPASPLAAGLAWGVIRTVVSSSTAVVTYAGPGNNPGQASAAAAWTARTTLVYGLPLEA